MLRHFAALCLVACGSRQPAPATSGGPANNGSAASSVGFAKKGEVCYVGARSAHDPAVIAKPCAEGLSCCYPCGIPGCDSVCMAGACPTDIP